MNTSQEMTVRQFLLGIASEEDARRVETGILTGELEESFLLESEDDLIDAYCLGKLTQEEQRAYTENFLISADRQQRHAFCVALIQYAHRQMVLATPAGGHSVDPGHRTPVPSFKQVAWMAVAACVLLAFLAAFEYDRMRREAQRAADLQAKLIQSQQAAAPVSGRDSRPKETSQASPDEEARIEPTLAVDFSATTRIGTSPLLLRIPAQAQFVRLQVILPDQGSSKYRALFVAPNGRQLWAKDFPASKVSASGQYTSAVPTSVLPTGIYHFKIEGNREFDQVVRVER